ncbi:MAG TPA: SUMF1/EgtB/PvdO family nonheme iron enzyme [Candidatus Eisenbacteria bacterium]|nr:SUMF1/EgtB/PvdO family nonheme iron enzyme [Candidatus Eisenbacteria bacterium]
MAGVSPSASGEVLCTKRNGVVVARETCKKKEAPLDLAQFGAVGPPGPSGPDGPFAWERTCPPDSVLVGTVCVDKYEASVWTIPAVATDLVEAVRAGTASAANLVAAGATQVSLSTSCAPAPSTGFPSTGNWTEPLYAASVPGVVPTGCLSWFQAVQACALAGKRLATNEEWQRAAAGTPNVAPCVFTGTEPTVTGTPGCVSSWGAFDMAGNVYEWVTAWGDLATDCTNWPPTYGSDYLCIGGDGSSHLPGALSRGGSFGFGSDGGIFAAVAGFAPTLSSNVVGFRCVR